mmetsp:Transcript_45566/g.113244  ORF Transcript_45566/g.113244 Transcript_45566/m.113244 type:complete len:105 (-) Transcript_45566:442-756(-)
MIAQQSHGWGNGLRTTDIGWSQEQASDVFHHLVSMRFFDLQWDGDNVNVRSEAARNERGLPAESGNVQLPAAAGAKVPEDLDCTPRTPKVVPSHVARQGGGGIP